MIPICICMSTYTSLSVSMSVSEAGNANFIFDGYFKSDIFVNELCSLFKL